MNWTGGALGRSRYNNRTLAVQKKHFANARTMFDSKQPMSFAFQPWTQQRTDPPRPPQEEYSSHRQRSRQRTLDDFMTTRPVVKKLKSIKPRQAGPEASSSSSRLRDENCKTKKPISISSRSSSLASSDDQDEPTAKTTHIQGAIHPALDSNDIEAQRRRLLQTDDWVGVNRNRPAKIEFRAAEDRDQIGKRRIISHTYAPPLIRRRKLPRNTSFFDGLRRSPVASQDYVSQGGVSIRIGSAVDRSAGEAAPGRVSSMQSSWSGEDEMILDEEAIKTQDRHPNSFPQGGMPASELSLPTDVELNIQSPDPIEHSSTPFYQESREVSIEKDVYNEQDLSSDLAARAIKLKEDIEQYQADDEPVHHLGFNQVLPDQNSGRVNTNSRSPIARDLTPVANVGDPHYYAEKQVSGSNSALSSIPSDNLATLHAEAFKHDGPGLGESWSPAIISDPRALGKGGFSPVDTLHKNAALDSSLSHEGPNLQGHVISEQTNLIDKNEAMIKQFLNVDVDKPSTMLPETETEVSPSLPLLADKGKSQPLPYETSLLQKERLLVPSQEQTRALTTSEGRRQSSPDPIEDEERIWRSFVFGDDDPTKSEWTFDEPEEADGGLEVVLSSPNHPSQTQQSMVAEVATSPIKQNPHLIEENRSSDLSTKSSPKMDDRSMLAEASSSSIESKLPQKEEMRLADLTPAQLSSDIPSPTSPLANVTISPLTSLGQAPSHSFMAPSSINAQVSTTTQSTSSSPDPLSLFPGPNPQAHQPSQHRKPCPPLQARRQAAVLFKKPARYVGPTSSDPMEPVVLGGKKRRSARVKERMRSADQSASRIRAGLATLEGEDTMGLGWRDNKGERDGDEIEDVE